METQTKNLNAHEAQIRERVVEEVSRLQARAAKFGITEDCPLPREFADPEKWYKSVRVWCFTIVRNAQNRIGTRSYYAPSDPANPDLCELIKDAFLTEEKIWNMQNWDLYT